jgi:hypothetical protein
MTRRDMCDFVSRRGQRLDPEQSSRAWQELMTRMEQLAETDMPKFKNLLLAIRSSTLVARNPDKT